MKEKLYAALSLPDGCGVDRRVYKKHFYELGRLTPADQRLMAEDVQRITWKYGLKPHTTGLQIYEDGEREYVEVVLLEVVLHERKRVGRLAEIMHQSIPYPLIVVFAHGEGIDGTHSTVLVSAAPKRLSRSGADALVIEQFVSTDWIGLHNRTPEVEAFLQSIHFSRLPHTHFKTWYEGFIDCIRALNRAKQVGRFEVATSDEARRLQQQHMERYNELEKELARLQAAVKREQQFNRQVELNMKIKRMKDELARLGEQ